MIDRRGFFSWLAGLAGFSAVGQSSAESPNKRGLSVFTVDVGNLPPWKAEAYIERLKNRFKETTLDYNCLFLPVRSQPSKIEFYSYVGKDENIEGVLEKVMPEVWLIKKQDKWIPPEQKQVDDYVLMMLGAPVVKIELDQGQLDLCYRVVLKIISESLQKQDNAFLVSCKSKAEQTFLEGVLAYATVVLGMIRRKYKSLPSGDIQLDGEALVKEGKRQIARWKKDLVDL